MPMTLLSLFSTKNVDDLITTINNDPKSLEEWLSGNKLPLIVSKTQAMMIGSKQKVSSSKIPKDSTSP